MPMYDYSCPKCNFQLTNNFVFNREEVVDCPSCSQAMTRLFPNSFTASVFPVEGITIEHAEANPITFRSKREMREYERKNNCEFGALL